MCVRIDKPELISKQFSRKGAKLAKKKLFKVNKIWCSWRLYVALLNFEKISGNKWPGARSLQLVAFTLKQNLEK